MTEIDVVTEKPGRPTIHYTVDGEPQTTTDERMTPRQIVINAGQNPDEHYLVQLLGRRKVSYQGRMDKPIAMREGMVFVTVFTGTAPVS